MNFIPSKLKQKEKKKHRNKKNRRILGFWFLLYEKGVFWGLIEEFQKWVLYIIEEIIMLIQTEVYKKRNHKVEKSFIFQLAVKWMSITIEKGGYVLILHSIPEYLTKNAVKIALVNPYTSENEKLIHIVFLGYEFTISSGMVCLTTIALKLWIIFV